jgi:hypothetical protein
MSLVARFSCLAQCERSGVCCLLGPGKSLRSTLSDYRGIRRTPEMQWSVSASTNVFREPHMLTLTLIIMHWKAPVLGVTQLTRKADATVECSSTAIKPA